MLGRTYFLPFLMFMWCVSITVADGWVGGDEEGRGEAQERTGNLSSGSVANVIAELQEGVTYALVMSW